MRDFSFGNLLTSYRTRVDLTQKTVAEKLHVALRTYQGWENGERLPSDNTMLLHITSLFELNNVEADDLYRAAAQVAPELSNLPFRQNPFFTGRDELLTDLYTLLHRMQRAAIGQPQAISGLGGIGKSQIAIEYAYRYRQDYQAVLWVRADSTEALNSSYADLARLLNLPLKDTQKQEIIVQAVKTWLHTHQKWLLILDNADEPDLLPPFLPLATFS
jgi:transcriptional regulator with XRE-family HTH domain